MANKEVNGGHCTVLWRVDELKWLHLTDNVLTAEIEMMNKVFGRKYSPLTIRRGKIHDCLGMTID